jgi:multidrug transporter EmrE-like cation transporter
MLYVFLSICCSVIVSVLLKLAKRYQIDVLQAITWNYSMAILLTWFFFKPTIPALSNIPTGLYLGLGILLPLLFLIMATSVRIAGIVRTDVAQRLSLFIPLLASFLFFGEKLNPLKVTGLIIGFAAILCSVPWQKKTANRKVYSNAWIYLLIVFFGIGVIDIMFKQVALFKAVPYTTSLLLIYILAFVFALVVMIIRIATKKTQFSWPHIMFGWILGVANFGNILFYLKAHTSLSKTPSTVFSAMNIGVIALGTLVGLAVFNERLSILNKVGVALAVLAIVVITVS